MKNEKKKDLEIINNKNLLYSFFFLLNAKAYKCLFIFEAPIYIYIFIM